MTVQHALDVDGSEVLLHQRLGGGHILLAHQHVEYHPAVVRADKGGVRHVVAPHLVDAVAHLEQARVGVELGVAPQARVHGVRGLGIPDECEVVQIPGDDPVVAGDDHTLRRFDQPPQGVLLLGLIGEIEPVVPGLIGLGGVGRRGFVPGLFGPGCVRTGFQFIQPFPGFINSHLQRLRVVFHRLFGVLLHAMAFTVQIAKANERIACPLVRRLLIVFQRLGVILVYAVALRVHVAQIAQRIGISLVCRLLIVFQRLGIVLLHATATVVQPSQVGQRQRFVLLRRLLVPLERLGVILLHAVAEEIHIAYVSHRFLVALIDSLLVILHRLVEILLNALAMAVQIGDVDQGMVASLFRSTLPVFQRLAVVLIHSLAIVISGADGGQALRISEIDGLLEVFKALVKIGGHALLRRHGVQTAQVDQRLRIPLIRGALPVFHGLVDVLLHAVAFGIESADASQSLGVALIGSLLVVLQRLVVVLRLVGVLASLVEILGPGSTGREAQDQDQDNRECLLHGSNPPLFVGADILECVSKCREMQFRGHRAAFQGEKPQAYWLQVKVFQHRNAA